MEVVVPSDMQTAAMPTSLSVITKDLPQRPHNQTCSPMGAPLNPHAGLTTTMWATVGCPPGVKLY